jgi:hypothetical protein
MITTSFASVARFMQQSNLTLQNPNFSIPTINNNSFVGFNNESNPSKIPGWLHDSPVPIGRGRGGGFNLTAPPPEEFPQYALIHSVANGQTGELFQYLTLFPATYALSFYATGRPAAGLPYGPNPTSIIINDISIVTCTPDVSMWNLYTYNFTINASANATNATKLLFQGTPIVAGNSITTAITGITLTRTST